MKKSIFYLFTRWWIPVIISLISIGLFYISIKIDSGYLDKFTVYFLFTAEIGILISFFYQLLKKKWLNLTFSVLSITVLIIGFTAYNIFSLFRIDNKQDNFADNLIIPDNIELHIPKEKYERINLVKLNTDFEVYNSIQPGIYQFDFWTEKTDSGNIYLKVYEITGGQRLSAQRIKEESTLPLYNYGDSIVKTGTSRDFTVFEGNWGQPYAARFEVWFNPKDSKKEYKIMEKIYKIEGWQR